LFWKIIIKMEKLNWVILEDTLPLGKEILDSIVIEFPEDTCQFLFVEDGLTTIQNDKYFNYILRITTLD